MTTRDDVARIALSLPQTTAADHFAAPSYRVKGKAFAILREEGRVTLKLDPEDQANLGAGAARRGGAGVGGRGAGTARRNLTTRAHSDLTASIRSDKKGSNSKS